MTLFEAGIVGLSEDDRLSVVKCGEAWLPRMFCFFFVFLSEGHLRGGQSFDGVGFERIG